jgi:high-affinity nickel permease
MFIAYLIQSTDAIDSTIRAIESDPQQAFQVGLLNESLDSAKVILTKVISTTSLIFLLDSISSLFCWEISRSYPLQDDF